MHNADEGSQHVYSVALTAREIWGKDASARDTLWIDLWEDYLVADPVAENPTNTRHHRTEEGRRSSANRVTIGGARLQASKALQHRLASFKSEYRPPCLETISDSDWHGANPDRSLGLNLSWRFEVGGLSA